MSWGALAIDFVVALAVWIGAAWLWRRFGEPKAKPRDSEMGSS